MKQVVSTKGQISVIDTLLPKLTDSAALVQVCYSCISPGTEVSTLHASQKSRLQKAWAQPEKVKKAIKLFRQKGLEPIKQALYNQTQTSYPLGYSAAGIIVDKTEDFTAYQVGDIVACAGAQYAHHASFIAVPKHLMVKVPEHVPQQAAATVTLGTIALQGVRRLKPQIGECVAVIGLGALGQLTHKILNANGCRVVGIDLDTRRLDLAAEQGVMTINPSTDAVQESIRQYTNGDGVDGVIITAASQASQLLSSAFNMCRQKGRVVVVGDVCMDINREDIYKKELDVYISCSYGPGRYDEQYERYGIDYPKAYVPFTENRNMQTYINLLAQRKIAVSDLIELEKPVTDASEVYENLLTGANKPLLALLSYPHEDNEVRSTMRNKTVIETKKANDTVHLGILGCSQFLHTTHLPHLRKLRNIKPMAASSRNGLALHNLSQKLSLEYISTEHKQIINDTDIDAVLIVNRHNQHAELVLESLRQQKHVFVEKPLATSRQGLQDIMTFYEHAETDVPILYTGFNRAFSPHIEQIRAYLKELPGAKQIVYRMNAGYIPASHWIHSAEGGGRNIGEACHIYQLFCSLIGHSACSLQVQQLDTSTDKTLAPQDFTASFKFKDGSIACLHYAAQGATALAKEYMEIHSCQRSIIMDDYKTTTFYANRRREYKTNKQEKGHQQILEQFCASMRDSTQTPLPLWQQFQAMTMAFDVEEYCRAI